MKKFVSLLLSFVLCLTLTGCGSSSSEDNGKLTVYMPSPAGLADNLVADFEAKTGIDV